MVNIYMPSRACVSVYCDECEVRYVYVCYVYICSIYIYRHICVWSKVVFAPTVLAILENYTFVASL